jgi:hypothetical protein
VKRRQPVEAQAARPPEPQKGTARVGLMRHPSRLARRKGTSEVRTSFSVETPVGGGSMSSRPATVRSQLERTPTPTTDRFGDRGRARGGLLRQQPFRLRAISTLHDVLPPPAHGRHPGAWRMSRTRSVDERGHNGCFLFVVRTHRALTPTRGGAPPPNHFGTTWDPWRASIGSITRRPSTSSQPRRSFFATRML